jgi:hypothetical protein
MMLSKTLSARFEDQLKVVPRTTPLQKLFMILGCGIFVALACLTAALPIPRIDHRDQKYEDSASSGDTAWMIVATIFSFFTPLTVAYLYGMKPFKYR